jgi:hypothetical protein
VGLLRFVEASAANQTGDLDTPDCSPSCQAHRKQLTADACRCHWVLLQTPGLLQLLLRQLLLQGQASPEIRCGTPWAAALYLQAQVKYAAQKDSTKHSVRVLMDGTASLFCRLTQNSGPCRCSRVI